MITILLQMHMSVLRFSKVATLLTNFFRKKKNFSSKCLVAEIYVI